MLLEYLSKVSNKQKMIFSTRFALHVNNIFHEKCTFHKCQVWLYLAFNVLSGIKFPMKGHKIMTQSNKARTVFLTIASTRHAALPACRSFPFLQELSDLLKIYALLKTKQIARMIYFKIKNYHSNIVYN